jgi:hypothetical protein
MFVFKILNELIGIIEPDVIRAYHLEESEKYVKFRSCLHIFPQSGKSGRRSANIYCCKYTKHFIHVICNIP